MPATKKIFNFVVVVFAGSTRLHRETGRLTMKLGLGKTL
jgi:hypothetical protein